MHGCRYGGGRSTWVGNGCRGRERMNLESNEVGETGKGVYILV